MELLGEKGMNWKDISKSYREEVRRVALNVIIKKRRGIGLWAREGRKATSFPGYF